jgi:hypothetical protein
VRDQTIRYENPASPIPQKPTQKRLPAKYFIYSVFLDSLQEYTPNRKFIDENSIKEYM